MEIEHREHLMNVTIISEEEKAIKQIEALMGKERMTSWGDVETWTKNQVSLLARKSVNNWHEMEATVHS